MIYKLQIQLTKTTNQKQDDRNARQLKSLTHKLQ